MSVHKTIVFSLRRSWQVFSESSFPKTFDAVVQDSYVEQTEAFTSLFENKSKYKAVMSALADMLYQEFNKG